MAESEKWSREEGEIIFRRKSSLELSELNLSPSCMVSVDCVFIVVRLLSHVGFFCVPMDDSLPGSSVHGISQARTLEWVCHFLFQVIYLTQGLNPPLLHWQVDSLPLSHQGSSLDCVHVCVLSHFSSVWLFATLWTTACEASLSMGFSRQEYWSGLPCPPPGDLPHPGTEPVPPELTGRFFTSVSPGKSLDCVTGFKLFNFSNS